MLNRCINPAKPYYFGRVSVCERWHSFENFLADMGERPSASHSIDRIKNEQGYEPENCRWATQSEQMRNTSHTRLVTWEGVTRCISEWSVITGIKRTTLTMRQLRGVSPPDIFRAGRLPQ